MVATKHCTIDAIETDTNTLTHTRARPAKNKIIAEFRDINTRINETKIKRNSLVVDKRRRLRPRWHLQRTPNAKSLEFFFYFFFFFFTLRLRSLTFEGAFISKCAPHHRCDSLIKRPEPRATDEKRRGTEHH